MQKQKKNRGNNNRKVHANWGGNKKQHKQAASENKSRNKSQRTRFTNTRPLSRSHLHSEAHTHMHIHTFAYRPDEKNRSKTINVLDENVFFISFYFAAIEKS